MPVNYGLLQPQQAVQAPQVQIPQPMQPAQAPSEGGEGDSGLGGLLGGLKGLFGANPISTTNNAIQQTFNQTTPQQIASTVLGGLGGNTASSGRPVNPGPQQSIPPIPGNIAQLRNTPQNASIGSNMLSVPAIQQMAAQQFPNNPTMQQLAVAQAAHESNLLGKPSQLASQGNNLFGVKGQGSAGMLSMPTTEFKNGSAVKQNAQFAAYKSPMDSMKAYADLMHSQRYAGVMNAKTFPEAVAALQKTGYATDPNYGKAVSTVANKIASLPNVPLQHQPAPKEMPSQFAQSNVSIPHTTAYSSEEVEKLRSGGNTLSPEFLKSSAYQEAAQIYAKNKANGTTDSPMMAVVDFSQPANSPRMHVINMETGKEVMNTYVAHGSGSGGLMANQFSNDPNSHESSLGTFKTAQTYQGKHGLSMRIDGLDKGVNDNARARDVVIHGANYVGEGKQGRSFGCFAVPEGEAPKFINVLGSNSLIYAHGPSNMQTANLNP